MESLANGISTLSSHKGTCLTMKFPYTGIHKWPSMPGMKHYVVGWRDRRGPARGTNPTGSPCGHTEPQR